VLGLLARREPDTRLDATALRRHLHDTAIAGLLADIGIEDEFALLGGFVGGSATLRRFAGGAPLNTDDHPVVAYLAPRITYAPDSLPRERLAALLRELSIAPGELLDAAPPTTFPDRLAAYWRARDQFIAIGQEVRPSADVHAMLSQLRGPLLAVLAISPDFRPAYDPLLRMAQALGDSDAAAARTLLTELARIQPGRPEARAVLALPEYSGHQSVTVP
jgi:spermidine synthase